MYSNYCTDGENYNPWFTSREIRTSWWRTEKYNPWFTSREIRTSWWRTAGNPRSSGASSRWSNTRLMTSSASGSVRGGAAISSAVCRGERRASAASWADGGIMGWTCLEKLGKASERFHLKKNYHLATAERTRRRSRASGPELATVSNLTVQ